MKKLSPEAIEINELASNIPDLVRVDIIENISYKSSNFPIHKFTIGNSSTSSPTLILVGGVHGLERIGTHVVISYLKFLFEQLKWNKDLRNFFKDFNLVAIPMINPVGVTYNKRSNGNGVDLMRNAPIDATSKSLFLVGGHRIGPYLPWYRGIEGEPMEKESEILCKEIKSIISECSKVLVIDFHSGFGLKDRLWYPYAKSAENFPAIDQVNYIKEVFDRTIPHHIYQIEPQSDQYTTHGDLWDYLFDWKEDNYKDHDFIPWTLEMGSWNWLRKNPIQVFSKQGFFNPIKNHRYDRTMRRHLLLIDFFSNITKNWEVWKK